MKLFTFLLCLLTSPILAQGFLIQDTLLSEDFQQDPSVNMSLVPTGQDLSWVNWDEDGYAAKCAAPGTLPKGWYWESDLNGGLMTDNFAFTSCSYTTLLEENDVPAPNRNWLITPPIALNDASYFLCWRSLTFQGPEYMDGYKVLISAQSNLPFTGDFSDTLFKAAEMVSVKIDKEHSLNLYDYILTPGYVHANGFTDTAYYYLDEDLGPDGMYRGKFEPHCQSLAAYAGKTVYIAFLHDSYDDFLLQVDDIMVSKTPNVATQAPNGLVQFGIQPNPVSEETTISWEMIAPTSVTLRLSDATGKVFLENIFEKSQRVNFRLEAQNLPSGLYFCTLQTPQGAAVRRLVKI